MAASESALPASVPPMPPVSTRSASSWAAIRSASSAETPKAPDATPPAIALPMVTMSGSSPQARGRSARTGRERVGLVVDQQGPVLAREPADRLEVARLGQDDADVGERRLHQHDGDVAMGELGGQAVDVVELRDPGGERDVHGRADVPPARATTPSGPSTANDSSTLPW